MHAGELEASVLLATYPTYVRDGWNTTDHSAPDRRYLTTLGTSAYTRPASLANHPRQQEKKDWVPLTTSAPQPEHSSACSHRHTTEHVRRGGSRPLALPSATTDRSALPPRAPPTSPRNDAVRTFCTAIKIENQNPNPVGRHVNRTTSS